VGDGLPEPSEDVDVVVVAGSLVGVSVAQPKINAIHNAKQNRDDNILTIRPPAFRFVLDVIQAMQ
jgi:hypothetical protein